MIDLWTTKPVGTADQLRRGQPWRTCPQTAAEINEYSWAYMWMVWAMNAHLGPAPQGTSLPVWTWPKKEDQRSSLDKGQEREILHLRVDESRVLLSDFHAWETVVFHQVPDQLLPPLSNDCSPEEEEHWHRTFERLQAPLRGDEEELKAKLARAFQEMIQSPQKAVNPRSEEQERLQELTLSWAQQMKSAVVETRHLNDALRAQKRVQATLWEIRPEDLVSVRRYSSSDARYGALYVTEPGKHAGLNCTRKTQRTPRVGEEIELRPVHAQGDKGAWVMGRVLAITEDGVHVRPEDLATLRNVARLAGATPRMIGL